MVRLDLEGLDLEGLDLALFICGYASIANQQHVHVMPMSWTRCGLQSRCIFTPMINNRRQRTPIALDVTPISPQIAPSIYHSIEWFCSFITPKFGWPRARIDNVTTCRLKSSPSRRVSGLIPLVIIVAAIQLQIV